MDKIYIPPIKIQGIKTKILPTMKSLIPKHKPWIEPFMGSGVAGLDFAENILFSDTNPHIINFYNNIKNKTIPSQIVRDFLEIEGEKLSKEQDYYYEVRKRFNESHNSLDFLFLNRSCFNGMIRFNKSGNFNVPFCKKPDRFSKVYITKIVNQVKYVEKKLETKDLEFACCDFYDIIKRGSIDDFIYFLLKVVIPRYLYQG